MAYYIDKEKYGTYIFFQYKLNDLSNLKELSGEFEHNPNVLRYLNIKIAEQDIMKPKIKENAGFFKNSKIIATVHAIVNITSIWISFMSFSILSVVY